MKRTIMIGIVLMVFFLPEVNCQRSKGKVKLKQDSVKADSIEYKLIVIDPGFDSWLATKPPMNFYSKEYYELKNKQYVTEWNYRNQQPLIFGDLYDSKIEYYFNIDYGVELNYRLYYYFRFFEETNHIRLINQTH